MTKKHVTVLYGGWNDEQEVSRSSAKGIIESLHKLGHKVTAVDIPRDPRKLLAQIPKDTDVIFNALHGHGVEDGTLQGLLNLLGIPYTHSGVLGSVLSMHKPMAKRIFSDKGIPTPKGGVFPTSEIRDHHVMPTPYVVKPCFEGSSMGVHIIQSGMSPPTLNDWHYGDKALVEEYIPGREFFVSIMGTTILGTVEVRPKTAFYDYTAKYTSGMTEYLAPAPIDEDIRLQAEDMSIRAFNALECRGIVRTDIRYDPERPKGQQLYLLEVNTQPGFTPLSLVPQAAKTIGLSYDDLVDWLVKHACCDPEA